MNGKFAKGLSPFRYPGGKNNLVNYVAYFMEKNGLLGSHLVEPFAGGAAISINLLDSGVVSGVHLIERDPLIYSFWDCLVRDTDNLCNAIMRLDVSIKTWKAFQKYRRLDALEEYSRLNLAVAGIFFNRANFSGVIGAKPIGGMDQSSGYPIDCRWNPRTIVSKIETIAWNARKIKVSYGDAVVVLKRNTASLEKMRIKSGLFLYIDPPYYVQGPRLYRYHFNDFGHKRLANYLNGSTWPWLVSYDDNDVIKSLFGGQKIIPFNLKYTVKSSRQVDELLITNQRYLPSCDAFGSKRVGKINKKSWKLSWA